MDVNHLWREALLSASRTLRKKVLKGRIWGFGSPVDGMDEDDTPTKRHKRRVPSTVDEDMKEGDNPSPKETKYRGGRVRGIVESLERSSGSSGSGGSDETEPDTSFDERLVKELKEAELWIGSDVENVELDTADLSASSASDTEPAADYHSRDSSGSQPPAYTRIRTPGALEEPSIEELLASERGLPPEAVGKKMQIGPGGTLEEVPSWGAMMWEQDADVMGGTAKRIVEPIAPPSAQVRLADGGEQLNIHALFGDANAVESEKVQPAKVDADAYVLLQAFKVRLERMEKRLAELEKRDEERERELVALREREKQRREADEEQERREQMNQSRIDLSSDLDMYAGRDDDDEDPVDIRWPRPTRASLVPGRAIMPAPLVIPGQVQPITVVAQSQSATPKQKEVPGAQAIAAVAKVNEGEDDPPLEMTPPDPSPSDLPAYVLLVGVGVCTVVLRVLFRKIASGKRT